MTSAFLAEEGSIDFPYERASFRYEQMTGKVFRRFSARAEREVFSSSDLSHQALCTGSFITRNGYVRD